MSEQPTETAAPARTIGVVGAGTMGAGIAQLACRAGARTLLHDPIPEALAARRGAGARRASTRKPPRASCSTEEATGAAERLQPVDGARGAGPLRAGDRGRARATRAQARAVRAPVGDRHRGVRAGQQHLLAADHRDRRGRAAYPERVVGMHFFNPAPVMRLLEVVAGEALRASARSRSPTRRARRWARR